jgi:hypothetical protein
MRAVSIAEKAHFPAAAERSVDRDKVQYHVAAYKGELILLVRQNRLKEVHAGEVGGAGVELSTLAAGKQTRLA